MYIYIIFVAMAMFIIGRAIERKIGIRNVLDCFSGCGGNTIPFAKKSYTSVTAIDIDTVKLQYLK